MRLALLMIVPRMPNCENSGHCGSCKPALLAVTPIEYARSRVLVAMQEDSSAELRAEIGARDVAWLATGFGSQSSVELRADREVVLAAVCQDGTALQFASAELQADREVVLAAVQQFGRALQWTSAELQADSEIVRAAVRQDGRAIDYASADLSSDRDVVLALVQHEGLVDTEDWDDDAELDEAADPNGHLTDLPMLFLRYLWLVLRYLWLVLGAVLPDSRKGLRGLDDGMHRVVVAEGALVEVRLLRGRLLHLVRVKGSCSGSASARRTRSADRTHDTRK